MGLTTNVDEFRAAMLAEAAELGLPRIPRLSPAERSAILKGDGDAIARLGVDVLDWSVAVMNVAPSIVSRMSFGFREQRALAEMIVKRVLPERLQVDLLGEMRTSTDRELLELAYAVGALRAAEPALQAIATTARSCEAPVTFEGVDAQPVVVPAAEPRASSPATARPATAQAPSEIRSKRGQGAPSGGGLGTGQVSHPTQKNSKGRPRAAGATA